MRLEHYNKFDHVRELENAPCYGCCKSIPLAELTTIDGEFPYCPKCVAEIELPATPVFDSMCGSLELGWTLPQLVAVFKQEIAK